MVSPELIRRYPFFAKLSMEQIVTLAKAAQEWEVPAEHYFFREGEALDHFYVVLEGQAGILVNLTDERVNQPVSEQLTGSVKTREVVVTRIGPGEVFAWSALVPPHEATSSGKALIPGRVLAFDCLELRQEFEDDCQFRLLMLQKATQIIRERMRDLRIEILSDLVAQAA
jgi:CRP-like cAMP-binding protein